ncbi:MAG: hypothetical protein A2420_04085 [Candidatus Moranbacteria bacterium RIFOXYC1_FULL_44_13]|nr:MAG: hypothetical protein A2420_04085 [Candidatus Moranbacteria bacterium RIFOXYC1_FULL_44_13]OGI37879.1 MAG: hypothetical protein A2612_02270 [Candidatus Moranbacteria bacterium RIFOXYD1_FULL_44_12]
MDESLLKNKRNEECFICGGNLEHFFLGKDIFYEINDKEFTIYSCDKCGLQMIKPLCSQKELNTYYPRNYYSYQETHKKGILKKLKMNLVNINYDKDTGGYFALLFKILCKIINVEMHFGIPLKKRGENYFLDIGCGDGEFVTNMSRLGWESYGYEIGERRKENRIFYNPDFTLETFDGMKFDCIRIWHVFEHIANPEEYLKKILSLLSDKGIIYLGLPNTSSINAKIFKKYWFGYDVPRHQINYNFTNLTNLLNKYNLKVIRYKNSGNMFFGSLSLFLKAKYKINVKIPFILSILPHLFYKKDCINLIAQRSNNSL